ncbi:putative reverse transcriptase domain-containing protein [Tanacetum coccineum]
MKFFAGTTVQTINNGRGTDGRAFENTSMMQRDPQYWDNPLEFNPNRFLSVDDGTTNWYQEPKFLIKMSPRRSEGEESEYPFFEGDGSSSDEWGDYGVADNDYEGPPVFDDDQYEEESMPVYDIDIEDIEEEEGFIEKGGFGREEDNIENVVVVTNDLCSSMIQTTSNVDFEEDINTKSHQLMSFGKGIIIKFQDDQGSRSSHYKERKFDARDTNLDATSTRDE